MSLSKPCFSALAITIALAAGACGDDDEPSSAEATTTTTAAAADTEGDTIDVTAVDYGYQGLPDDVPAGSTLSLRNDSDAEVHELVAMRLADDETRTADELLALPQAELEALFGGPPALVLVAPPGEDAFVALGDGSLVEPGRYLAVCFIPTGADPIAFLDALEANPGVPPQVDGGPPHFTGGMFQELTVS